MVLAGLMGDRGGAGRADRDRGGAGRAPLRQL